MKKTFRLATLNVHLFNKPRNYENNLEELIEILRPLELDFLGVEEMINDNQWSTLCERLSLSHFVYGESGYSNFGNGIASRFPINAHLTHRSKPIGSEIRSCLQASFDVEENSFLHDRCLAVTHLDHCHEDLRMKQLKYFDPVTNKIDILLGDFNALTRDDYSEQYLTKRIVDVRKNSLWESAHFDVTNYITETLKYHDAFKMMNPQTKDEKLSTCRFDTRIDYIYFRPKENDRWTLKECFIEKTNGATDHHAVVATFQYD